MRSTIIATGEYSKMRSRSIRFLAAPSLATSLRSSMRSEKNASALPSATSLMPSSLLATVTSEAITLSRRICSRIQSSVTPPSRVA
ncbi:hypothetical protein D3C80_1765090 [compost metagenome]